MTTENLKPARGKTFAEAMITGVAAIGALVLVNFLTCGTRARWDLTENKIYSLSDASRELVRKMPEKVKITAYFGNVPSEREEDEKYVEMMLEEYEGSSGGNVTYAKVDPWGNKDLMADLKKDPGIEPLQLMSRKSDKVEEVPMYFHVVFENVGKKDIWSPNGKFTLEGLEYEFTTRIKRLGYGKKNIGITTGFGEPQQTQVLSAPGAEVLQGVKIGLEDMYDLKPIDWKKDAHQIDDKLDALIVNGPTEKISDDAKFALDQYIMRGKPVLFLVHGMTWSVGGQQQQLQMQMGQEQPYLGVPADDGLKDLLAAYGFEVEPNVVLDGRNNVVGSVPPAAHGASFQANVFYPLVEVIPHDQHDMLAGIQAVVAPFASTVKLVGPLEGGKSNDDTKVQLLLRTLPTALSHNQVMAVTRETRIQRGDKDAVGAQPIAYAVSAKFNSLYATAPPPPGATGEPLKESAAHTRLIVAGVPMIADDASFIEGRGFPPSLEDFVAGFVAVHDMVDWLVEDTQLVAVRAKTVARPLKDLSDGKKSWIKAANVYGSSLLLVLVGVFTWWRRDSRRRSIAI